MANKRGKIIYDGTIKLSETVDLPCFVLEDGTRVLSARGFQNAAQIGERTDKSEEQKSGSRLGIFLSSKWFKSLIPSTMELGHFSPIDCYKGKQKINGYEATVLVDLCDLILQARKDGRQFSERQKVIADQCEILVRSFAKVGIIALVDEATGYQHEREKDELQKILRLFISEELMPWKKRFPDELYKEIFRLNGWPYTVDGIKKRPGIIGTWTKEFIYGVMPKGVLDALLGKVGRSSDGKLKTHLHRRLTKEEGVEHLNRIMISVVTLMNISETWQGFKRLWGKKFLGVKELDLGEDYLAPKKGKKPEKPEDKSEDNDTEQGDGKEEDNDEPQE